MNSRWRSELAPILESRGRGGIVLLGVGNPLRGDDGVGGVVARGLAGRAPGRVIDGGSSPENFGEGIAARSPEVVLVIDAARWGGVPGAVKLLRIDEVGRAGLTTHNASLTLLASYLHERCGCEVVVLGVEPSGTALGSGLSAPCRAAAGEIVEFLSAWFPGS